ncbi:MAG: L,D-transpeptidase family protein [Nocardioidaceae bacterium]|nr:L,D-transpeptidase family protein [Nocardioidaceae bacterium]
MSSLRSTGRARAVRGRATVAVAVVLTASLAGCTTTAGVGPSVDAGTPAPSASPTAQTSPTAPPATPAEAVPTPSAATVNSNLPQSGGSVPVDQVVELTSEQGTFESVEVTYGSHRRTLRGDLDKADTRWASTQRLEPGLRYTVRTVAVDDDGRTARERSSFRTDDLALSEQTFPSIAPLQGETVGVGMPVIMTFDVAVTDRAAIERHISVESSPRQAGAWHWLSDNEVHWRPRTYWQPGTDVTVTADINSIPAGNGIYGQLSRTTSFSVGDAVISRIDVARHRMRVFRNGTMLRTIPISAGKPGFITRSGTKVIIEKFRAKRMDAATTGIDPDDPEYYNMSNVEYAMRVTYSGEFLHAAPWSLASQGNANVSHGCVGMSTEDARWVYGLSNRGDVVEVTGTDRQMTLTNGYGDWNASFDDYRQGSAL